MGRLDGFMAEDGSISLEHIKKIIPYGEPFLFIDKINFLGNEEIIAERKLRDDEDFFRGHFSDFPVMPGVLLIEGLGQSAVILLKGNIEKSGEKYEERDFVLYGIREAKFLKPAFPGETIRYIIKLIARDDKLAVFSGQVIKYEDEIIAEVLFAIAVTDKSKFRSQLK